MSFLFGGLLGFGRRNMRMRDDGFFQVPTPAAVNRFVALAAVFLASLPTSTTTSTTGLATGAATPSREQRVLPLRFQKSRGSGLKNGFPEKRSRIRSTLARREDTDDVDFDDDTVHQLLENEGILYLANVTVGTPPQPMQLQIDTASSDIWVLSKSVPACSDPNNYDFYSSTCHYGSFDPASSRTFKLLGTDEFSITYVDGSTASGDYAEDTFAVGDAGVEGMQIGVAKEANLSYGVMGVGFEGDQASTVAGGMGRYPNLVNEMVSQDLIHSKAFSLWLDDLASDTGSILFGGVDKTRFKGNLTAIPLLPPPAANHPLTFAIPLTSVALADGSAHYNITSTLLPTPVILDSGTSLTFLPHQIASTLANQLGGKISQQLNLYIIDCSHATKDAYVEFEFAYEVSIRVPISELVLPLTEYSGDLATSADGSDICALGFAPSPGPVNLFGDTFLRSAYVVFDLDNQRVAMAQTEFNPKGQNIVEIGEGRNSIPFVDRVAPAMTIAYPSATETTSTESTKVSAASKYQTATFLVWNTVILATTISFLRL